MNIQYSGRASVFQEVNWRLPVALLSVVGVILSMVIVAPSASAVERSQLYITDTSLTRMANASGVVPGTNDPLYTNDELQFSFEWDATQYAGTENAPKANDTITVTLPDWVQFPAATVEMRNDDGQVVANCVQTAKSGAESSRLVCTFTDFVETNTDNLKGGFSTTLNLVKASAISPTSITVGSVTADLSAIASPEVIAKGVVDREGSVGPFTPLSTTQTKGSYFAGLLGISGGKAVVVWNVVARGTGGTATVIDHFSAPQKPAEYVNVNSNYHNQSVEIRYRDRVEEGAAGGYWNLTTDRIQGTAHRLTKDQFEVIWTQVGTEWKGTVNIPNTSEDRMYHVSYVMEMPVDAYQNGDKLSNTATVNGEDVSAVTTARAMTSAYASGDPGKGSIYIYKRVEGTGTAAVPADLDFEIEAQVEGEPAPRIFKIKAGSTLENAAKITDVPVGKTVTIKEKQPVDGDSYTWNQPVIGQGRYANAELTDFTVNADKTEATVIVTGGKTIEVGIRNDYTTNSVKTGTLQFKKIATGPTGDTAFVAPTQVRFTYTCTADSADGAVKANTPTEIVVAVGDVAVAGPEFPVGTECKVTKETEQDVANYADTAEGLDATITIAEGKVDANTITITNTYTKSIGQFKITKTVTGPVGSDKEFTFRYTCTKGTETATGEKKITGNGEAVVTGIPVGAACEVTEDDANIEGYTLHTAIQGGTFTQEATEGQVAVLNTYSRDVGGFTISKKVVANDGVVIPANKVFDFDYTCEKAGAETLTGKLSVADGATATKSDIPVGYSCSVVEDESAALADVQNATVAVTVGAPVVIAKDTVADIAVTNTYNKANSQFKIVKTVQGPVGGDKVFTFDYICTKAGDVKKGTTSITGAGEALVTDIPVGADCVVTEQDAQIPGYSLVTNVSGGTFTQNVAEKEVTISNTYTKNVGKFSVTKELKDVDGVATGKKFTFTYECTHPDMGNEQGEFTIGAGQSQTISDIAEGSTCVIKEAAAEVDGADLTTSGLKDVTIVKDDTQEVVAVNEYNAHRATIELTKELVGSAKNLESVQNLSFKVNYVCTLNDAEVASGNVEVKAGTPAVVENIRSGADCVFTEDTDAVAVADRVSFDKADSVTTANVTVGAKGSTASVSVKNHFSELGKISLTKVVAGLSAGSSDNKSREFEIEASWKNAADETVTERYKVSVGSNTQLPALPVGTVITVKEVMPENTNVTTWETPGFSSETPGVVKDNKDGTAELTVVADSFDKPVIVKVTNTANIPWWWILIPVIPAVVIPNLPKPQPPAENGAAPSTPLQAGETPTKGVTKSGTAIEQQPQSGKAQKKTLAQTGASVLGILVVASILAVLGVFLVRRGRTTQ